MTTIYLSGAENSNHQPLLAACAAQHVAVNVTSLLRRRTSTWTLDLPYTEWDWVAFCDAPARMEDLQEILDHAAKPPSYVIGPMSWDAHPAFVPLWNGEEAMPYDRSKGMVITDRVFRDKIMRKRSLSSRTLGTTLGVVTGSIDDSIGKFDIVISGSWWSAMKYGETQVWTGSDMRRYNTEHKSEARLQHREAIERMGLDFEAVMLDDPEEVCRLAILSWQAYGDSLSKASIIPFPAPEVTNTGIEGVSDTGSSSVAIDTATDKGRHQTVLPVMGLSRIIATERDDDGTEIIEEQTTIASVSSSIRSCDNCYLASAGCPGARPASVCAYSIPVEIKSKDQLQAAMQALIEMQTQRVMMARFAEEIAGQELSPEVGKEMDRWFASVEKMRDIMDNRDTLKMTVEAKSGAGVLSRLFGDRVGANARMLNNPVHSDDVIDAFVDE